MSFVFLCLGFLIISTGGLALCCASGALDGFFKKPDKTTTTPTTPTDPLARLIIAHLESGGAWRRGWRRGSDVDRADPASTATVTLGGETVELWGILEYQYKGYTCSAYRKGKGTYAIPADDTKILQAWFEGDDERKKEKSREDFVTSLAQAIVDEHSKGDVKC